MQKKTKNKCHETSVRRFKSEGGRLLREKKNLYLYMRAECRITGNFPKWQRRREMVEKKRWQKKKPQPSPITTPSWQQPPNWCIFLARWAHEKCDHSGMVHSDDPDGVGWTQKCHLRGQKSIFWDCYCLFCCWYWRCVVVRWRSHPELLKWFPYDWGNNLKKHHLHSKLPFFCCFFNAFFLCN